MKTLKSGMAGLLLAFGQAAQEGSPKASKLPFRTDRPRLLFTKDQLPAIKKRCEGPYAEDYKAMTAWADGQVRQVLSPAPDGKVRAAAYDFAHKKYLATYAQLAKNRGAC